MRRGGAIRRIRLKTAHDEIGGRVVGQRDAWIIVVQGVAEQVPGLRPLPGVSWYEPVFVAGNASPGRVVD